MRLKFILLSLLLSLTGCGFQPMYESHSTNGSTAQELKAVEIATIPDRTGQILRNALMDRFYGDGGSLAPKYWLEVSLQSTTTPLGIRKDATATLARLQMTAQYTLRDISTGKIITQGNSRSTVSYNIPDAQYTAMVSEQDARQRALNDLAQDMTSRLALYFNRKM